MKSHIVILIQAFLVSIIFGQDDKLTLTHDSLDIIWYNKDYVTDPVYTLYTKPDGKQSINATGTLKKDLGMDLKVTAEIFGLENGEYYKITSIDNANICDMMKNNYLGLKDILLQYGNFTDCPVKKGYYATYNAIHDDTHIPPTAPTGKFKAEIEVKNDEARLLQIRWTGTIKTAKD